MAPDEIFGSRCRPAVNWSMLKALKVNLKIRSLVSLLRCSVKYQIYFRVCKNKSILERRLSELYKMMR